MAFLTRREALANPARALVHGILRSVPGITLTDLAARVGLETSSVQWHLRKLADAGLVGGERHGTHRIFFAADTPPEVRDHARAAHCLASDATRRVLDAVVASDEPLTARAVGDRVGATVAQVRHQLHRLRQNGLVDRVEQTSGHLYVPSGVAVAALRLADAYGEGDLDPVQGGEAREGAEEGTEEGTEEGAREGGVGETDLTGRGGEVPVA